MSNTNDALTPLIAEASTALADILAHLESKSGDDPAKAVQAIVAALPAALAQAMKNMPAPKVEVNVPAQQPAAAIAPHGWRVTDIQYGPHQRLDGFSLIPVPSAKRT
ncbi:MAG: hypothetical protein H0W48_00385 [Methylibium sp.]|nr:hypothetical protein [Methylibium sp.]